LILDERDGRPLAYCVSCRNNEALADLMRDGVRGYEQPAPAPRQAPRSNRNQAFALATWDGMTHLANSIGEIYLQVRCEPRLIGSTELRFAAWCPHPDGTTYPAMVGLIRDVRGNPIAIHRTYLAADGRGKAAVEPNRATLGPFWGGAVRLDPEAPELVIGEGIESSASAGRLLGLPAWSATNAGNLASGLVLPDAVRAVVIAADRDPPGEAAAHQAAARWQAEGRTVRIARPDRDGEDFNDIAMRGAGRG
jgi:phage/plasmid primase-like uncharacterized protein